MCWGFVCLKICFFKILEEIEEASIRIYQFPECDSDEDEDFVEMNKDLKVRQSNINLKRTCVY